MTAESFTCPRCGKVSYHPGDIAEGYCGGSGCHWWTGDPLLGSPEVIAQAEIDGAIARGEFPGSGMLAGQGGRLDLGRDAP